MMLLTSVHADVVVQTKAVKANHSRDADGKCEEN